MTQKTIYRCKIGLVLVDVILLCLIGYLWTTKYFMWNVLIGIMMCVGNVAAPSMLHIEEMIDGVKHDPSVSSSTYKRTLLPNRIPRNGGRSQRLS